MLDLDALLQELEKLFEEVRQHRTGMISNQQSLQEMEFQMAQQQRHFTDPNLIYRAMLVSNELQKRRMALEQCTGRIKEIQQRISWCKVAHAC